MHWEACLYLFVVQEWCLWIGNYKANIFVSSSPLTVSKPTLGRRRVSSFQLASAENTFFRMGSALLSCLLFAKVTAVQYCISKFCGNIFIAALYSCIAFCISFFSTARSPLFICS